MKILKFTPSATLLGIALLHLGAAAQGAPTADRAAAHHGAHGTHGTTSAASVHRHPSDGKVDTPTSASYAGQHTRPVKALSDTDMAELSSGAGRGLAKPAELNGYPGPAHVLELADALALSAAQRDATETLMRQHRVRASSIGERVIEAERALDLAFATRQIDEAQLDQLTGAIGALQAELRAEHLRTHLIQARLMTHEQVTRYAALRGYAAHDTTGATYPAEATPARRQDRAPAGSPPAHRH